MPVRQMVFFNFQMTGSPIAKHTLAMSYCQIFRPSGLAVFLWSLSVINTGAEPISAGSEPRARFAHPTFEQTAESERRRIVFFTDDGAHGWMQHEHTAGAILFAKRLCALLPATEAVVLRDQFPDAAMLARASSVVLFCSGSETHPLNDAAKRASMETAMAAGTGLVALHWALEAGTAEANTFLKSHLGGYFELDYSVNPMWKADIKSFTEHPVTRGLSPYTIYDEFYFNMRFPDVPGTRTVLAEAIPPKKVILLPEDGPRSNNPVVRASLGKSQALAWAFDRPAGGRSFGFTGGHFHWDWKDDQQRRLLLNAIAWTAKADIPATGLIDETPSDAELMENQDSSPTPGWKPMPGQPPLDTTP